MPKLPAAGSGTITIEEKSELRLNGRVYVSFGFPGTLKNPRIRCTAFQEGVQVYVNELGREYYGDKMPEQVTFRLADEPDAQWTSGPADVTLILFYFKSGNREWNGQGEREYVELAQSGFRAEGGA